jgi:ABC-type sugar transport system ATPase subunit
MDVTLEGVRVDRDRRQVLDIPSLRIRGRRTTAVLGPNGSGKTTLLRVLAGLDALRTGSVRFGDGDDGHDSPPIAFVFQEEVFLRRSVRANLELGLRLRGVKASDRTARVVEAVERLGISHLLDRRADELSGGEGRRVSLARALCLRAPLVLLDEPLAGLDERTYARLMDALPGVLAAFDATTLLVTHSRQEALRLAEELVILIDGRVQAAGPTRDVAANPSTGEVADVLGYDVLPSVSGPVAIWPGSLVLGRGAFEFSMLVEDVQDLLDGGGGEVVGRIGDSRVHVRIPAGTHAPSRGERAMVHAKRACVLPI